MTLLYKSKINKLIKKAINDPEIEQLFTISGPKELGEKYQYGIVADLGKFKIID